MNRLKHFGSFLIICSLLAASLTACKGKEDAKVIDRNPVVTDVPVPDDMAEQVKENTGDEAKPTPSPMVTVEPIKHEYVKPEGNVTYEEVFQDGFEGELKFVADTAKVTLDSEEAYEGDSCLYVSNRSNAADGAFLDITDLVEQKNTYYITAYVKFVNGKDNENISLNSIKDNEAMKSICTYTVGKGEWVKLKGTVYIQSTSTTNSLCLSAENGTLDFYVDNVTISKMTTDIKLQELPALKDVYADYFSIGGVLGSAGLQNDNLSGLILSQCNSLTLENEMKPDSVLDNIASTTAPIDNERAKINMSKAEAGLKFASENGLKMRGHTLVWHSQTPEWFFHENFSSSQPYVTREVMLKRMENYIADVMDFCQTNYPGIIYVWDVVNEAFDPGSGHPDGLRTESNWYKVVGDDFIEKAFEYARKYADPEVKLFYNDYNTEETAKMYSIKKELTKIYEQGNIDGIGLQSHIGLTNPSIMEIDTSVRTYAKIGLEIQFTELDMGIDDDSDETIMQQAKKYKMLFLYMMKWKNEGINVSNVTFWGTTDDRSWLNSNGQRYPLLFDKYLQAKPAFWGVLQDDEISLY